ncbi:hypothetical protein Bca52824_035436 [Brassica carinata]|uniref:Uncharacterized protein n=1 Tax=Brassica carinata TaxID=52824 RepID=A0A8X7V1P8_BRACI|nr:hypothetical protein Bca52824_035436 [Brassica carinata]
MVRLDEPGREEADQGRPDDRGQWSGLVHPDDEEHEVDRAQLSGLMYPGDEAAHEQDGRGQWTSVMNPVGKQHTSRTSGRPGRTDRLGEPSWDQAQPEQGQTGVEAEYGRHSGDPGRVDEAREDAVRVIWSIEKGGHDYGDDEVGDSLGFNGEEDASETRWGLNH